MFRAEYRGRCRRCGAGVTESLELVVILPPRGRSPAELRDSALFERRRYMAAELLADPSTDWATRERLERDYLAPGVPVGYELPGPVRREGLALPRDLLEALHGTIGRHEGAADHDRRRPEDEPGGTGEALRDQQGAIRGAHPRATG